MKNVCSVLEYFLGENYMKKQNLITLVLASALLASCGTETNSSSVGGVSSEITASSSEVVTPSSEEVSSSTTSEVSSESSSSSEAKKGSWADITERAAYAIKTFFEAVDPSNTAHDPDDYLPFFETEETYDWYYDDTYNYAHGTGLGLVCKTGTDANANKALIAAYNEKLEAAGLTVFPEDDKSNFYDEYWTVFYADNVWKMETDFDIVITVEVITVAEANEIGEEGNDYDATTVHDQLREEVTDNDGVYFLIQSAQN